MKNSTASPRAPAAQGQGRLAFAGGASMISLLAGMAVLVRLSQEAYGTVVQEDQAVEWATVSLLFAATLHLAAVAARRGRDGGWREPWFPALMAAGSLLVGLEEVSWGQRLLGFQPPRPFLEGNLQQELNLHNLVGSGLRTSSLACFLRRLPYRLRRPLVPGRTEAHLIL